MSRRDYRVKVLHAVHLFRQGEAYHSAIAACGLLPALPEVHDSRDGMPHAIPERTDEPAVTAPPTSTRHATDLATPSRRSGARHQHKLDTLAALRNAALRLALDRGLSAITVADIATAAGVSRRTFFNYFATKEDALVGETPQFTTHLHQALAARPEHEPPLTAAEHALQETYAVFYTDDVRDRIRARHQLLNSHPELLGRHLARYAAFENVLVDALSARRDTSADPELLATLIASAVRLCTHRWAHDGDPSLAQRLTTAFAHLRHDPH